MGENLTLDDVYSSATSRISNNAALGQTPETGIRLCPLCNAEIKLFFINFNEKLLMCENTECEFPFGYEDLQFVKEDNGFEADAEVESIKYFKLGSAAPTGSVLSTTAWYGEINQINEALQTEVDTKEVREMEERIKIKETEDQIRSQLEDIKALTIDLQSEADEPPRRGPKIRNQKWLQNLRSLQEKSGIQLLNPEEVGLLKKEKPELGLGELKIDINPGDGETMSSITIEIHNNTNEMNKDPEDGSTRHGDGTTHPEDGSTHPEDGSTHANEELVSVQAI